MRQIFHSHGAASEAIVEKILIRDGFYCGRCFSCDSMRAVWFIEENSIKFYHRDGSFLFACPPEQTFTDPARRVA